MNRWSHITKHIPKRIIILFLIGGLLFANCFMLESCGADLSQLFGNWNPTGDWSYDLMNGYAILRVNSCNINLGKLQSSTLKDYKIVVGNYITCFAYNERYIVLRDLDVPDGYKQEDILQMDFEKAKYYIVDTQTHEVYGSYNSAKDFDNKCVELGITDLCDWIDTYPAPEGAIF